MRDVENANSRLSIHGPHTTSTIIAVTIFGIYVSDISCTCVIRTYAKKVLISKVT